VDFKEYQALARRTQNTELSDKDRLEHALFGCMSKLGEIAGIYQKAHQGHAVYFGEVAKELGDLMWFIAELADCIEVELDDVAKANIEKLKIRYPGGFTAKDSIERRDTRA
jgi:NTP pyrophosphatase (non-canonical NTP hydrolase)